VKFLFVIGSSGHAAAVLECIELQEEYEVIGLLDSFEPKGTKKHGYVVYGGVENAAELSEPTGCRSFFVAIGDNFVRWRIASLLSSTIPGIEFPILAHPSALVSKSARIGPGTVLTTSAIVGVNAIVGQGCIVNVASAVNHDCRMDDFSSLSAGVQLGGGAAIGFRSSVGVGATLKEKVVVGRDTVVGAGAVVTSDLPDNVVAYGVPAKVIKQRAEDEKYLR
jgi:sugar O-acyltransferase (sialic acid O-acetyltransferase NeuD family)